MGAHSRPNGHQPGKHRGEAASLITIDARRVGTAVAVAGVAAGTAVAFAPAAGASTLNDFARLRGCESGGNYAINTGNGYYGAYQFSLGTWRGLGYAGLPSQAAPAVQDQAAQKLQAQRGWQPWPGCSRRLGLTSAPGLAGPVAPPAPVATPLAATAAVSAASVSAPKVLAVALSTPVAPAFGGTVLSTALVGQRRADVAGWQGRMRARGWSISVDGHYGAQSARAAARFAEQRNVPSGAGGVVDAAMWNAAWTLPVT